MALLWKPVKLICKDVQNNMKYNRKVVNTQYIFKYKHCTSI